VLLNWIYIELVDPSPRPQKALPSRGLHLKQRV
jgi:hypothetical protein